MPKQRVHDIMMGILTFLLAPGLWSLAETGHWCRCCRLDGPVSETQCDKDAKRVEPQKAPIRIPSSTTASSGMFIINTVLKGVLQILKGVHFFQKRTCYARCIFDVHGHCFRKCRGSDQARLDYCQRLNQCPYISMIYRQCLDNYSIPISEKKSQLLLQSLV